MKTFSDFVKESLNEGRKEEYYFLGSGPDGDEVLTLADENGQVIEFDTKEMKKILDQCKGWITQKFIDLVFSKFPEVDTINIEHSRNNEEPEIYKYTCRSERVQGWQLQ